MKLDKITVSINRGAGLDIVKTVWPWEVRVLKAIHNPDKVVELGRESADLDFNEVEEFGALVRKYGTAQDSEGNHELYKVFRDPDALADAMYRETQQPTKRGRPVQNHANP